MNRLDFNVKTSHVKVMARPNIIKRHLWEFWRS